MNSYGPVIYLGGLYGLTFLIPLALFLIGRRVRRRWVRALLLSTSAVSAIWAGYLFLVAFSYGWALHLETEWRPANPTTRSQIEHCLSLYTVREIDPKDSMWGRDYVLRKGEKMIQYMIVWDSPLDVVYDEHESIMAIYTSYE